jgi:hypothetical protein
MLVAGCEGTNYYSAISGGMGESIRKDAKQAKAHCYGRQDVSFKTCMRYHDRGSDSDEATRVISRWKLSRSFGLSARPSL